MNKPPLELMTRHFWLKQRVSDCIDALKRLEDIQDWSKYREQAKVFSNELHYAVTEWEKYYNDV